jgi:hypothetical protein
MGCEERSVNLQKTVVKVSLEWQKVGWMRYYVPLRLRPWNVVHLLRYTGIS